MMNIICRSQEKDESTESCSVVIVGAGMAGLGAAKTLLDAGVDDFLILEGTKHMFLYTLNFVH